MRSLLLAAVVVCAGCSTHRYFAPRENRNGYGPGGHPAAVYDLGGTPSAGEVRLWSRGAWFAEGDDERVELHAGFELENHGDGVLAVVADSIECDQLWIDGERTGPIAPARVAGLTEAGAGGTAQFDVWFDVPAPRPRAIEGFAIRFRIAAGDRTVLAQSTPFAPFFAADRAYYHDPFWGDPYWYGFYWGPANWGPAYWGPAYHRPFYWGPVFGWSVQGRH